MKYEDIMNISESKKSILITPSNPNNHAKDNIPSMNFKETITTEDENALEDILGELGGGNFSGISEVQKARTSEEEESESEENEEMRRH